MRKDCAKCFGTEICWAWNTLFQVWNSCFMFEKDWADISGSVWSWKHFRFKTCAASLETKIPHIRYWNCTFSLYKIEIRCKYHSCTFICLCRSTHIDALRTRSYSSLSNTIDKSVLPSKIILFSNYLPQFSFTLERYILSYMKEIEYYIL